VKIVPAHDVRLARPSEAASVAALVGRAYQHYVARIGQPPAPMTADYRQAIADRAVWVLVLDDEVQGVLVLHSAADHLLIDNVAVDPAQQGLGLGGKLLLFAEQHARRQGLDEIRLYTNALMTENLAYYPRRGYAETGRHLDGGFSRVFFTKRLE
jgi:GNAT superfamily N-acetyltransferase